MRRYQFCGFLLLIYVSGVAQTPTLFPFRKKDKFGYIDGQNVEKLRFMFDWATPFSEGKAYVESGKWRGYVRENGTWAYYDSLSSDGGSMEGGVAEMRRSTGSGAIDSTGKVIVPFEYSFLQRYNPLRVFLAHKTVSNGNESRKIIHLYTFDGLKVPVDFDQAITQADASALGLRQQDKVWVYGKNGRPLLDFPVDDIYSRQYGARIQIKDRYGAINRAGELVLPVQYKDIWISEWAPYAEFKNVNGDTSAYYDLDKRRVAFTFRGILSQPVSDGLAIISYVNNLHNVHDLTGQRIGQLQSYEDTSRAKQKDYVAHFQNIHFSEGLVTIRHADKKWYAYNKYGRLAFPNGFEAEFEYSKGVAIVRTNGYSFAYGLIDKTGKEIFPLEYNGIYRTSEPNVITLRKDNFNALAYTNGRLLYSLSNLRFRDMGQGFFLVEGSYEDNYFKYGYVNTRTGLIYYDPKDR